MNEIIWRTIESAPKNATCLWLWNEEWMDEDYNPSGVVDGFWNDDAGWVVWSWNGSQECYDTHLGSAPSHWAYKVLPPEFNIKQKDAFLS